MGARCREVDPRVKAKGISRDQSAAFKANGGGRLGICSMRRWRRR